MTHLTQAEALNKNATYPAAGAIHAIIEHLKEQKQYGMWQVCPMCHGYKFIPGSYYTTDGAISVNPTCHICEGQGVMVRPEIRPGE